MRMKARSRSAVQGGALAAVCFLTLAGCVSTEPVSAPPHVNLSPEKMQFADSEQGGALDFGLDVTRNESDSLENLAVLPGLRVRSVRQGSAADLAGVQAGDVLLNLNGTETNQPDALAAIARSSDAEQFTLRARRGTTVYETTLPRPRQRAGSTPEALYRVDPVRSRAGYATELAHLSGGEPITVARIVELFPDSPLADADLKAGDLIIGIDGEQIQSAQDLVNELSARPMGERVNLTVIAQSQPKQQTRRVAVKLWAPERRLSSLGLWPLFHYESSLDPEQVEFSLLDFILFSLFDYERQQGETTYRLLGIIEFGTGYGQLVEQ